MRILAVRFLLSSVTPCIEVDACKQGDIRLNLLHVTTLSLYIVSPCTGSFTACWSLKGIPSSDQILWRKPCLWVQWELLRNALRLKFRIPLNTEADLPPWPLKGICDSFDSGAFNKRFKGNVFITTLVSPPCGMV